MYWLPDVENLGDALKRLAGKPADDAWTGLVALAKSNIDLVKSERLARAIDRLCGGQAPGSAYASVRLAILGSGTLDHLTSGIRVGALRRNIWLEAYLAPYGQYAQELADPSSGLHQFRPTAALFAFDAQHLTREAANATTQPEIDTAIAATVSRIRQLWKQARDNGAHVFQQLVLPTAPGLMGSNEHRVPWSPRNLTRLVNARLTEAADADGVDLIDIVSSLPFVSQADLTPAISWHRAKQDIHPGAAHLSGEVIARVIAARLGRSAKCLVLDLDNTLWGGVIGDDGLNGIVLGQGSATGEAFVAIQNYARDLRRRGILLAVCSKNDEQNALEPFEKHPDMVLKREDISCFVANWNDKPSNLIEIAKRLNIGLDALVFLDDNPFERNIVRQALPMVSVPEVSEDASDYVQTLADAGYFEACGVTEEDMVRAQQYRANEQRERAASTTDLPGYLASLGMELKWRPFDQLGLQRVTQLINKSNQFNLTTRRYSPAEVEALVGNPEWATFQFRLLDAFGDNGMISVIIGRHDASAKTLDIDTWLMSCRVLGRQVEQACLNVVVEKARALGCATVTGHYIPTAKNGMVATHYRTLGFAEAAAEADAGTAWTLDVGGYQPFSTPITILEETHAD